VRALAALAAWRVTAADAAEPLALGSVPELATAVVFCVAGVAAEVTAEAADLAADVTVLVAGVEAGGGVAVAVLVGAVAGAGVLAGGGLLGASAVVVAAAGSWVADVAVEVAAELTAEVADVVVEVAGDVVEEVTDVTSEVSVLVTGAAAEPPVAVVEGAVEACAWRENTSKTTRIPAASIAHCAARRAARRKASCGIGSSPRGRLGPDTTAHP
jgi:hypothetical protein